MTHDDLAHKFTDYAATRLHDSLLQIEKCLNLLSVEQIWRRPNDVSNAVGNLVIHLSGNVRQWILGAVGGQPVERDRPAEFAQRDAIPTETIMQNLRDIVAQARVVIERLTLDELLGRVSVQGYDVSRLEAVFHVVEHFSLHTGQIVYATKLLTGRDLSLYDPQGRRIDGRTSGTP